MKRSSLVGLCCGLALLCFAMPALAADPPVKATAAFTSGAKTPGSTNTAKATITISDGSALVSVQWKQIAGAPVVLANALTDTVTITMPDITAFRPGPAGKNLDRSDLFLARIELEHRGID